ncbi:dipeptidase [Shewanella yunxiaonensis]|uniref:Dipeptidase n=2 Tax=Shewanella yunxiaonensis TaxID=2829809 RepID=A0ABX7YTD9_9GAMM|nr:dipeptidase [Shewanella yunxiaonensis]
MFEQKCGTGILTASMLSLVLSFAAHAEVSLAQANAIQRALLTLDTHLDTPANLVKPGFDIMQRHSYDEDFTQVDVPRMNEGLLDGGFWAIFSPQGPLTPDGYEKSRDTAILRALAIHTMVTAHPDTFGFATEAAQAAPIKAAGKHVVFMSIENAYPLGTDLSLLTTFYKLGVRLAGPVHFKNNQLGDSSTDPEGAKWGGLSPLGEQFVAEANRLGIVLDGSHAGDATVKDMIRLSKTPIMLSHSGSKAVYAHPRNVDDDLLKALAASGGVIQMNAYSAYLKQLPENPQRKEAFKELMAMMDKAENGDMSAKEFEQMQAKRRQIEHDFPAVKATFDDYMEHFLHTLKVVGPLHVGIGADWDGGGGVEGMMDVASLPKITQRLLEAGYTKEDLANIWGLNALRVLKQAEDYAKSLSNHTTAQ